MLSCDFPFLTQKENITLTQRTPLGQIKMALLCVSATQWSGVGVLQAVR